MHLLGRHTRPLGTASSACSGTGSLRQSKGKSLRCLCSTCPRQCMCLRIHTGLQHKRNEGQIWACCPAVRQPAACRRWRKSSTAMPLCVPHRLAPCNPLWPAALAWPTFRASASPALALLAALAGGGAATAVAGIGLQVHAQQTDVIVAIGQPCTAPVSGVRRWSGRQQGAASLHVQLTHAASTIPARQLA